MVFVAPNRKLKMQFLAMAMFNLVITKRNVNWITPLSTTIILYTVIDEK